MLNGHMVTPPPLSSSLLKAQQYLHRYREAVPYSGGHLHSLTCADGVNDGGMLYPSSASREDGGTFISQHVQHQLLSSENRHYRPRQAVRFCLVSLIIYFLSIKHRPCQGIYSHLSDEMIELFGSLQKRNLKTPWGTLT